MPNSKIGIVGSGMIGTSLAALFTGNGHEVAVATLNDAAIEKSRKLYQVYFGDLMDQGLVTRSQFEACRGRIGYSTGCSPLSGADIVIESVYENIGAKHAAYREIEKHCDTVRAIGSTTSAFTADALIGGLSRHRDKFMIAHPWNPPHLVPLVEVVAGPGTVPEAVAAVSDLFEGCGHRINRMTKGAPGFISNRLQHAMLREAFHMVSEGIADPREIDKAIMYGFAPRYASVGLFEHQDAAGLDLVKSIEGYLFPSLSPAQVPSPFLAERNASGKLGMKSGSGVYEWDDESIQDYRRRASRPFYKFFKWKLPT